MKKILEIRDALIALQEEKTALLPKMSEPYSEEDRQRISDIDKRLKDKEEKLKSALVHKYGELSDSYGQIPGYSKTDFLQDMRTSYNKVIERLQEFSPED